MSNRQENREDVFMLATGCEGKKLDDECECMNRPFSKNPKCKCIFVTQFKSKEISRDTTYSDLICHEFYPKPDENGDVDFMNSCISLSAWFNGFY